MRAFIAVDLPESVRQEIAAFQAELKKTGSDVKWIEVDNLHLTLKFLGDIEEDVVEKLKQSLGPALVGTKPFEIHLEGIGAFPKTTFPRVIWVGVNEGSEKLVELAQGVEGTCEKLGIQKEERPFSAHLTIGRVKSGCDYQKESHQAPLRSNNHLAPLVKKLQVAEFRAGAPAPIDRVILYQSTLSPHGPTYTPLAEFPLG